MKKFIFPLLLTSFSLSAAEIFSPQDGKQIVSSIKDIEVKEMLEKTSEFNDCRKLNKFDDKAKNLKAAEDCFKDKLGTIKDDGKKLKALSEALNLQQYGLVKSNNSKDIQEYLNDKMYESMTGVNRKEENTKKFIDDMKFGKKKHIDQKTFITLYKTQLSKNALYEISRFCFENLRQIGSSTSTSTSTFGDHWKDFNGQFDVSKLTDSGIPTFGTIQDSSDKSKIYKDLFASMNIGGDNGVFSADLLSKFFTGCGQMITELCNEFKKTSATESLKNSTSNVNSTNSKGATACLTRSRLQEIKGALASADLIEKEFDSMASNPKALGEMLTSGTPAKIFNSGQDANEESLDNLTNYTSKDIIEGGYSKDELADKKAKDCTDNPELSSCEDFFLKGEGLDKIKHNVEMELTLKREIEMERVKKLKADGEASLEQYLKDNGYFDILKDYKSHDDQWLSEQIGLEFEAKKMATLNEINNKLGKRQLSKDTKLAETEVKANAQAVVKQSKEERARLAQVVLFNNIITSHLDLTRKDAAGNKESAGRNVNAWKKEEQALSAASVDSSLFAGLKATDQNSKTKGIGQNEQLGGLEFINEILGAPEDDKKTK